jgi:hypothetical protein
MPIFYSKKEKGSKPYPNVKFRTYKNPERFVRGFLGLQEVLQPLFNKIDL